MYYPFSVLQITERCAIYELNYQQLTTEPAFVKLGHLANSAKYNNVKILNHLKILDKKREKHCLYIIVDNN